jgi:hypothetical protein
LKALATLNRASPQRRQLRAKSVRASMWVGRSGAMGPTGEENDMRCASALGFSFLSAVLCWANPVVAQGEPKDLLCSFTSGTASSYENGVFKTKPAAPLSFEIADIDLEHQTARLITDGREKPGGLKVVRAINANHFLEVANGGFLNLTTVYDTDPATGTHPAVHSRHLGVLGEPVFAQYAGFCKEK